MVRPVPIPNTAVKHCRADGSSPIGSARVGRRHSLIKNAEAYYASAFLLYPTAILGCLHLRYSENRTQGMDVEQLSQPRNQYIKPARLGAEHLPRAINQSQADISCDAGRNFHGELLRCVRPFEFQFDRVKPLARRDE